MLGRQPFAGPFVERDDLTVAGPHDQQGRRSHLAQRVLGEVGATAAGDHRFDDIRERGRGAEGRGGTGARPEQPDGQSLAFRLAADPVDDSGQPVGEQGDVEAQRGVHGVASRLGGGQQVEQHRAESALVQRLRHLEVARAAPAASAAVGEDDDPLGPGRDVDVGVELHVSRTHRD